MDGYRIADIVITTIACVLAMAFVVLNFKKKSIWAVFFIELVGAPLCYFLNLTFAAFTILALFLITGTICMITNSSEIRAFFANPITVSDKRAKTQADKDNDRVKLNRAITQAVKWLSDNRVGAIITFERTVPLDKYIASGTVINAPVTPELIETIFFEGTRLHDGAIIIRGSTIVAASVFYPATTRTVVGKFGARHRAALGISEVSDSVTIIVSEETGRISCAFGGNLEPIKYDEFEKVFSTFMLAPSGTIVDSLSKTFAPNSRK